MSSWAPFLLEEGPDLRDDADQLVVGLDGAGRRAQVQPELGQIVGLGLGGLPTEPTGGGAFVGGDQCLVGARHGSFGPELLAHGLSR